MRVEQKGKPHKTKAVIVGKDYDSEFATILYFMWHSGQLKTYPLDSRAYPDNDETLRKMTLEMLKMKLRSEQVPSYKNRILTK